jgi:hypothetical protein
MLVSHGYQFIVFEDPLGACPWLGRTLQPWLDQPILPDRARIAETPFFNGMTPGEAELAFDKHGLVYRNYARIAIIRDPFAKMAQLYYRIAMTDPVWRMRQHLGLELPRFSNWLYQTRNCGNGAGYRYSARWRKFGAWSADAWCGDRITHTVRANHAVTDLNAVFNELGIAPAFGDRQVHELGVQRLSRLYDTETKAIIRERYQSDLAIQHRKALNLHRFPAVTAHPDLLPYTSVA